MLAGQRDQTIAPMCALQELTPPCTAKALEASTG